MGKFTKSISFWSLILLVVVVIFGSMMYKSNDEKLVYSDLVQLFKDQQVKEISITDTKAVVITKDDKKYEISIPGYDSLRRDLGDTFSNQINDKSVKLATPEPPSAPWWLAILPTLGLLVIFGLFWFFFMQQSQGGGGGKVMSFGKSKAKLSVDNKKKVTFADVAGADEEKEELREVVDFLKAPKKYEELGARIPKGILLVGPPGTGKTLLAKAVSGEAGVPFFSISGSDFVEMFVGVGASRVRDLFEQAKKSSPCIVFIDEIDAVGRHRGAGLGGGHDEREQTLNQLLVEMDGFGINENVIIVAATNRPDILDPALLRPGRFDRQVVVGVPDVRGREQILVVHSRTKPLGDDVNLSVIAKTTAGFTGADLENLLNEAALLTARAGKRVIGMKELGDAMIKVVVGTEKKSRVITDKDKRLTAYHEAGHGIVTHLLQTQDPVHQISIIPRGRAGGYTMHLPSEDKSYSSKSEMLDTIKVLLAGRIAEFLVLGDISTGASNDIERASKIARAMVTKYGMSDKIGPIAYGTDHEEVFIGRDFAQSRNFSEEVAAEIDEEIRSMIDKCYKQTIVMLNENMHKLHTIANALIEFETIEGDEFVKLFDGVPLDRVPLSDKTPEGSNMSQSDILGQTTIEMQRQAAQEQVGTSQNPHGADKGENV